MAAIALPSLPSPSVAVSCTTSFSSHRGVSSLVTVAPHLRSCDFLSTHLSTSVASSRCQIARQRVVIRGMVETAAPVKSREAVPSKQKIRIKLRSYWVPLIEQACQQILEAAKNTHALTMGPVPLPTKRRVYCVLRSPHVDKDSREHFEIRTHRRLIDLANPNAQTIDSLMQLDLPAGVDVEVKLL